MILFDCMSINFIQSFFFPTGNSKFCRRYIFMLIFTVCNPHTTILSVTSFTPFASVSMSIVAAAASINSNRTEFIEEISMKIIFFSSTAIEVRSPGCESIEINDQAMQQTLPPAHHSEIYNIFKMTNMP